jgi:hypothetical protein
LILKFYLFEYLKTFLLIKCIKKINSIHWMFFVLFIFKASSFGLVGIGLDFTLLPPSSGCQVFPNICLVATRCFPSSTRWPLGHDLCIFSPCSYRIPGQSFPSIFWISTYFCKFCAGLTSPMTKIKASIHSWTSFCSNLSSF